MLVKFKDKKGEATESIGFLAHPVSTKEEMTRGLSMGETHLSDPHPPSCPCSPSAPTTALIRVRVPTRMASLLISIWLRKNFISSLG